VCVCCSWMKIGLRCANSGSGARRHSGHGQQPSTSCFISLPDVSAAEMKQKVRSCGAVPLWRFCLDRNWRSSLIFTLGQETAVTMGHDTAATLVLRRRRLRSGAAHAGHLDQGAGSLPARTCTPRAHPALRVVRQGRPFGSGDDTGRLYRWRGFEWGLQRHSTPELPAHELGATAAVCTLPGFFISAAEMMHPELLQLSLWRCAYLEQECDDITHSFAAPSSPQCAPPQRPAALLLPSVPRGHHPEACAPRRLPRH
jgi:hypothetical protein